MDTLLRGPLVFSLNLKKLIKMTINGCKMFTIQQKILYYVCIHACVRKSWDNSVLECPVLLKFISCCRNHSNTIGP
jgi:hypothetical protein